MQYLEANAIYQGRSEQKMLEIEPSSDDTAVRGDEELLCSRSADALDQLAHMYLAEMVLGLLQK